MAKRTILMVVLPEDEPLPAVSSLLPDDTFYSMAMKDTKELGTDVGVDSFLKTVCEPVKQLLVSGK